MIKVLHIYPKGQPLIARYVRLLTEAVGPQMDLQTVEQSAEAQVMCNEWQPDIVHFHGDTSMRKGEFRRIVSPCGMDVNIDECYTIIARSTIEAEHFKELGAKHIEVVLNPLITKTTDFTEAARRTVTIYQKVMDSDPLALMSEDTKRGVLPLVENGLRLLDIDAPAREQTESYLPEDYRSPESMAFKSLSEQLLDIQVNGPSLLRLTEIHQGLLNPRLNEDLLCKELDEKGMLPLFASVLQLLSEQTLLNEGFCPCPPADNSETSRLRTKLQKHLKL